MTDDYDLLPEDEEFEDMPAEPESDADAYPVDDDAGEYDTYEQGVSAEDSGYTGYNAEQPYDEQESGDQMDSDVSSVETSERLRQPRAQNFRRRLRTQISMLPMAVFLIALGGFLIAREQNVAGLPNLTNAALAGGLILAVGFTAVFHAVLFGRRERGLIFAGLWIWAAAGTLAVLVYAIDDQPDAVKWWPVLLVSTAIAFLFTYLIERTHDARLMLLSLITLVAAGTAFGVTTDTIKQDILSDAADYWPLLFTVAGIGLLPLVFRRRAG